MRVVAPVQCNIKEEKSITRVRKTQTRPSQKEYGEEEAAGFTKDSRAVLQYYSEARGPGALVA